MKLFPHNKIALESLEKSIFEKKNRKACVVHATGTGKSLIISSLINKYNNGYHLYFAPNKMIFNEIKKYVDNDKLIYRTYQFYTKNTFEDIKHLDIRYIYLDEFHRIGARKWKVNIDKLFNIFPNAKIIGTSATHIRFLDDNRNMAHELFDNNIVSHLDLNDAIRKKIHKKPIYISSFFDTSDIEKKIIRRSQNNSDYENRDIQIKNIKTKVSNWNDKFGLKYILTKHIGLERKKILVFISKSKDFQTLKPIFKNVFEKRKKSLNIQEIHSKYSPTLNQKKLTEFSNKKGLQILFSVDMANEGLHIKGVDTVILFRETVSPIVYFQQIGRAFSVGQKTTPLIIDLVKNIKSISIKDYFTSKKNIRNQKKIKTNEFLKVKKEQKKTIETVSLIDYTLELTEHLESFKNLNSLWNENIEKLKKHLEINKNELPSATTDLGKWIRGVKGNIRKKEISKPKERVILELLTNLVLNQYELAFQIKYKELKKNYTKGKNINSYSKEIRNFIARNKKLQNKGELSEKRKFLLEEIDTDFFKNIISLPINKDDWEGNYKRFIDDLPLARSNTKTWVRFQKKNKDKLSVKQYNLLSKHLDLNAEKIIWKNIKK